MKRTIGIFVSVIFGCAAAGTSSGQIYTNNTLCLPQAGFHELHILAPDLLELNLVQTKPPDPVPLSQWNYVDSSGQLQLPAATEFKVVVNLQNIAVQTVGYKRRPLYAPLVQRDLRVLTSFYLQLAKPLQTGQRVNVLNPSNTLWPSQWLFSETMSDSRWSPAIHVNQTGYGASFPKRAMVGYFLGSLGELNISTNGGFKLVRADDGTEVFQGSLQSRPDIGYNYTPLPYQQVFEADFSSFATPGEYKLCVPDLGVSFPFHVGDDVAMNFARTYALGIYHQRCGTDNSLPYTRHTHGPCHIALAEVPTMDFTNTQVFLAQASADYTNNARHTAPQLKDVASSLYPFVTQGKINVSGGHHDAGDYSKYTINSATFIHYLVFAADAFPGAGALDNLGIPESGDGRSDLLQEAKWEADFLARLQDADGGFYFLVYPRDRKYENNVLPDHGDPQVVWPKNTAVTAAAVAALAQCASSPTFKQQFPEAAATYLQKAQLGWNFLTNAIARYGKDGAYQKMTHYGDDFMHDDELAWAACEMFLATGNDAYQQQLFAWFPNPSDPATMRWGWWRLFSSYGCAIRSYAFAAATGRLQTNQLDSLYLGQCQAQILAAGNDALKASQQGAYGSSFPEQTKRVRGGGWYFSSGQAFDLAAACQLPAPPLNDPRPKFLDAILANFNYEGGCNPVNVTYVTGAGWRRQREIVHQYAQNDRRILPPSGLPLGNIQASFDYLAPYKAELGALCYPSDGANIAPYPFYDRWGDSFNVSTEFVNTDQARALATAAYLVTLTSLKTQAWSRPSVQITGLPARIMTNVALTVSVTAPGTDMTGARIVWETGKEPFLGSNYTFMASAYGSQWLEAEVTWPDGRRAFAVTNCYATNGLPTVRVKASVPVTGEGKPIPGQFTFSRDGDTNTDLTLHFSFSGTATKWADYRTPQGDMPESIVIPAGATEAKLEIAAVDDTLVEGVEYVVLTLTTNAIYNLEDSFTDTITILDNDVGIVGFTLENDNLITITWTSNEGKTYTISSKDTLTDSDWTPADEPILAAGPLTSWTDPTAVIVPTRFYRVLENP